MQRRGQVGHHVLALNPRRVDTAPQEADASSILDTLNDIKTAIAQSNRSLALIDAPWLTMPPDGESFHNAGGITLPATDGLFHTILSITVPEGRNGVLNELANAFYGVFTNFDGDLIWRLVRNPGASIVAAERNYEKITAVLGLTEDPVDIAPIRIYENDVIALQIQNVALPASGQVCGAVLGGWFYPKTWDDEFEQSQSKQLKVSW